MRKKKEIKGQDIENELRLLPQRINKGGSSPQEAKVMEPKGASFIKPPKDSTKLRLKGVYKGTKKVCHSMTTFKLT